MARVTVEDCVQKIPNRFELVMMAAQRARDLSAGASITIDRDNDKNPVVALREIADETVPLDGLQNALIKGHQKHVEPDEPEEDIVELMAGEQGWVRPVDENQDEEPVGDEETEDVYAAMEEDPDAAFEGEEEGLTDQIVNERSDGAEYD